MNLYKDEYFIGTTQYDILFMKCIHRAVKSMPFVLQPLFSNIIIGWQTNVLHIH